MLSREVFNVSNAVTVGAVSFDLGLNMGSLNQAVFAASRQIEAQLSGAFRNSLGSCEQSISGLSDRLHQGMRQMSQSISNAMSGAAGTTTQVNQAAGSAASTIAGPLTGAVSALGAAVAAAFSVTAVIKFSKSCIEAAAQVKALNAQVTQTFKTLREDAVSSIKAVADESGILETRLQGVGTQIYAFAKASGMDSATALNMMQEALQVTADSAAYYDRSLEDTAESLRSFLKGNFANDAALGVSCTQTTRNAEANKLFGKSYKDLTEAQKQLTLLQMVKDANELSGAMGQAAREADGWENVTGNLKEAWKQFKAAVGMPLLQALIPVVQKITSAIEYLTQAAKEAVQALSDLFGWDLTAAQNTGGAIADTAQSVTDAEDEAQKEIDDTAKKQKQAAKSLAGFDDLNVLAQPNDDNEDDAAKNEKLIETAALAKASMEDLASTIDTVEFMGIKEKIQGLIDFFTPIIENVKTFFENLGTQLGQWWDEKGSPVFEKLKTAALGIKAVVTDIWNTLLKPFFSYIGESLGQFWDEHLKPLWDGIVEFFLTVGEFIAALWTNALQPFYENFVKKIMVGVLGVLKSVWDFILDLFGIVVDVVRGIVRVAQGLLEIITGILTGDMNKAAWGFVHVVEGICIAIWGAIKGVINLVIDALNTVWSALYGVLKSIVDGVGTFVSVLGDFFDKDWGFSMPDEVPRIPRLAQGGLVKAPTLAIVGDNRNASSDPEVVSPLSKLNSMMGGGNEALLMQIVTQQQMILEEIRRFEGLKVEGEFAEDVLFRGMIKSKDAYKRTHGGRSPFA